MDLSVKTAAVTSIQSHVRGWLLRRLLSRTFAEYTAVMKQSVNFTNAYEPGNALQALWIESIYDEKLAKYIDLQHFIAEAESQQTLE